MGNWLKKLKFWDKKKEDKSLNNKELLIDLQDVKDNWGRSVDKYYGDYMFSCKMPVTFEIELGGLKSEIYISNNNVFTKINGKWVWTECGEVIKA